MSANFCLQVAEIKFNYKNARLLILESVCGSRSMQDQCDPGHVDFGLLT